MAQKPNCLALELTYGRARCKLFVKSDEDIEGFLVSIKARCLTPQNEDNLQKLDEFLRISDFLYGKDYAKKWEELEKKPLVRIAYIDGMYVLMNLPKRLACKPFYESMEELLKDIPLALFDIKIVGTDDIRYTKTVVLW